MTRRITVRDIARFMEDWAPPAVAWERDNVGLQIGNPANPVRGILVCLDVTEAVIGEAVRRGASLVISHHPLLFRPIKTLTASTEVERVVRLAVRHRIDVFSVHTNLDFARGGVSFVLADTIGLKEPAFLAASGGTRCKIVTFVPPASVDVVARAMAASGAGRIGNYEACSFRIPGTGTFRGNSRSNPVAGSRGRLEEVEEVRLEMVADEWQVPGIVSAMKRAHPYEEVAFETYPLRDASPDYGMGVIGSLPRPVRLGTFLRNVKRALRVERIRYTRGRRNTVHRVAVCGGSGSELLETAVRENADAFVTADVKYHTFHEAAGRISIIDAGHYETEAPVVQEVAARLRRFLRPGKPTLKVFVARTSTNPVMYD